jgi:hypothetical protein
LQRGCNFTTLQYFNFTTKQKLVLCEDDTGEHSIPEERSAAHGS